jgi:hypothetical protein
MVRIRARIGLDPDLDADDSAPGPHRACGPGAPKRRPGDRPAARGRFATVNAFADLTPAGLNRAEIAVWLLLWRHTKADWLARTSQANLARRAGATCPPPGGRCGGWSGPGCSTSPAGDGSAPARRPTASARCRRNRGHGCPVAGRHFAPSAGGTGAPRPRRDQKRGPDWGAAATCIDSQDAVPNHRTSTWSENKADGGWRAFDFEELAKRDNADLDILWPNDKSLGNSDGLPESAVLARQTAHDTQTTWEQFRTTAMALKSQRGGFATADLDRPSE